MIHELVNEIYVENEYGVKYIDYMKAPPQELVKHCEENYNIKTDVHNICLNCQINQINKYNSDSNWNVKTSKVTVFKEKNFQEIVGILKKYQRVTLQQRAGKLAKILATINYGICIENDSHEKIYAESKDLISQSRCKCGGGLSVRTEKVEGWVPFKSITLFSVKCSFIPKQYEVPKQLKNELTPEEQDKVLTLIDPVKWGKDVLGVELRDHQKIDVMCTAKHTVRRWGRRCLVGDTKILLSDLSEKEIKDILPGDSVVSYYEGKFRIQKVNLVYDNGIQNVYKVYLESGNSVEITENHPLLTRSGYKSIEDGLHIGDTVLCISDDLFIESLKPVAHKIKLIEFKGKCNTYDINVPDSNNFIANGVISHNSGKSFGEVYQILKYALTETIEDGVDAAGNPVTRGANILIASPYSSQISMLFDELKKLIARNPDIVIVRDVKTPFHELRFANGAIISGFTTGGQSGTEADPVRGRGADLILIDEADAMDEASIVGALQPIQVTTPNVMVMASSTPKGKQEWFFNSCQNTPHYRETYFPSTVLDHWDEVKSEIDKEGHTETSFRQEYMAEFVAQLEGVYQPQFISEAEVSYEYRQLQPVIWNNREIHLSKPIDRWIYSIGVDWNTNAGVEIAVTGLDKDTMTWWVVDAVNVPKQNYQQHRAADVVVKLHEYWDPQFVYVDFGFGGTQFEYLQAYSERMKISNPGSSAAKLGSRLKAYNFGSYVPYRNPTTGTIEKQPSKPFLVENSVRQFEQGRVKFSDRDYVLHSQLLNYIVESISVSGLPRYGMNDVKTGDHRLDALNLALIAYILEMSDYSIQGMVVTKIAHTPGFGSSTTKELVSLPEQNWIEFKQSFPEGTGMPGRLNIRYDPAYVEMKEHERQHSLDRSRTSKLDNPSNKDGNMIRLGFDSDTEWKHKLPTARSLGRSRVKPKRRSW